MGNPRLNWLLLVCVMVGFALRAYLAVSEFGLIHADEQFQTLEPASRLVFGYGSATWEWLEGSRSWLVPLFYAPVLAALKLLGVGGGSIALAACRLFMVLFSLFVLWRFDRLLRAREADPLARFAGIALYSLLPTMIYWAPTTFSDSWAAGFLWIALAQSALFFRRERKWDASLAAFFFGLCCVVRIQLLPWAGVSLLLFFLMSGSARREIFLAALLPVLGAGALDWVTWGAPFISFYRNFYVNLFEGMASLNGIMPWYAYPELLARNLGQPYFLAAAAAFAFLLSRIRRWEKVDWLIFPPSLLFLATHSLIPHKETRFMLPLLPLLFYSYILAASEILRAGRKLSYPAPVLLLLSAALLVFSAEQTYTPHHHYNELDISEPSRWAYEDGLFRRFPESCLLLVNEKWIWSRGELGFGQEIRHVSTNLKDITSREVNECAYAILPAAQMTAFIWLAHREGNWQAIGKDRWGHYLFRNLRKPAP